MQRHFDEATNTAIITFTDCKHWIGLYKELQTACKLPKPKRTKYGYRGEKKYKSREAYREMCRQWAKISGEYHSKLKHIDL